MKSCLFLIAACLLSAVTLSAQDTTAPLVTSISIPGPVNLTSGPANISVTLQITDDVSGFRSGSLYLYRDEHYVKSIEIKSTYRTSGTPLSGTYEIPVEVPGFGTPGTWRFEASIYDDLYNSTSYGTGAGETPFPVAADATFDVTNSDPPDTDGPISTNVDFSPLEGNVSTEPLTITATFDLTDAPSGFDYGFIYVDDPNGDLSFENFGNIDASKRISGNPYAGSYKATAIIPKGAMSGTWKVYLGVRDKLGNYSFTPRVPVVITSSAATGGLADACDATQFPWTTSGDADWTFHTATTYDGIDAARSGAIGDNQQSVMELEVTGPGTLTFWWKTDCASGDVLSVDSSGSSNSYGISGQSLWTEVSLDIDSGPQTVTWTYAKDSAGSIGEDAGWVDRVYFAAEEDTEAPVVQYLKISPNPASIADGDVDITLTFEVSDDYSGVTGGEVIIADSNGTGFSTYFDSNDRLPGDGGDESFGTYQVSFTLPQSDFFADPVLLELGVWQASITVEDDDSNSRYYGPHDDAFPVPGSAEFTVTDQSVGAGLGIASIDSFAPDPVDISAGTQPMTVNFTLDDAGGTFSYGNIFLYRKDGKFVANYFFDGSDGSEGQFSVTMDIPRYGQPGEWRVAFRLTDTSSNDTDVSGPIQNPGDDEFTVINNSGIVDNDPVVVSSISISPKVIDTSTGFASIAVTVGISDALSGLGSIFVNFIDPSGNESSYKYVNGETVVGGSFTVNQTLPQGSEEGVWHCSISTRDKAGNYLVYGPDPGETGFPVAADAEFTVGTVTGSSFAAFASGYSLTGNDALLGANPDNDWASNALEFLLGLDPTINSAPDSTIYQASRVGDGLRIDFKPDAGLVITNIGDFLNVANAAGDAPVRVTGQMATDLAGPWTNILPVPAGDGVYRVTLPIGPGARGFCRLIFLDP